MVSLVDTREVVFKLIFQPVIGQLPLIKDPHWLKLFPIMVSPILDPSDLNMDPILTWSP